MGGAFAEDWGSEHPQMKQARITATGLPSFPVMVLMPVESSELDDSQESADDKAGVPHPMGPSTASKEQTLAFYESQVEQIAYMEAWYKHTKAGSAALGRVTLMEEFSYADGSPGAAYEVKRAMCFGRRTSPSGQAGHAMVTYTVRYQGCDKVL